MGAYGTPAHRSPDMRAKLWRQWPPRPQSGVNTTKSGVNTHLREQCEASGAERDDGEQHGDQHEIVMPPIAILAPIPGMPHKNFLLDGAPENHHQAERRIARQHSEHEPETPRDLRRRDEPHERR